MHKKPILLGFSGKMGVGKTTAANYLCEVYGFIKTAFADPVKQTACHLFDLTPEDFISGKELVDPFWGITRRDMLQKFGTDAIRETFGYDFWTRRAEAFLVKNPTSLVVFDDVRFKEEVDFITSRGGFIINIKRDVNTSAYLRGESTHASETQELYSHFTVHNYADYGIRSFCSEVEIALSPLIR